MQNLSIKNLLYKFLMIYMGDSIKKLTDLFAKFPTIGHRTAGRFVSYLLSLPKEKINELASAIIELKNKVKFCQFCFNSYEDESNFCPICKSPSRDKELLCIVEKEADLTIIENTKKYHGLYFILGGVLNSKNSVENLKINGLKERLENPKKFGVLADFKEIIIALNPTPEGRATSVLIEKSLQELNKNTFKITHLAKGLPVGGELEYADQETLEEAFEGRK